jgi:hypothetical protein
MSKNLGTFGVAGVMSFAMLCGTPVSAQTGEAETKQRLEAIDNRLDRIERLLAGAVGAERAGRRKFVLPQDWQKRPLASAAVATQPLSGDGDRDGLTDAEEVQLGTDPQHQDTDGDALWDGWEVHGVNGIDLPAFGASPLHKDVFVEMDFMTRASAANGLGPNDAVLRGIETVFAAALVSNPDGSPGITIHLEMGNEVPFDGNLQPAEAEFATIKRNHFDEKRAPVFHYMIWADRYNGGTSSGNSFAIPNSDFIVTLGGWNNNSGGSVPEKIGTFVHELGHNLGLMHGGSEHLNYKPNHLSVMNYSFQTRGISRNGRREFDYQRFPLPTLDELAISEQFGLGSSVTLQGYRTIIQSPSGARELSAFGPIDWNSNGQIDPGTISADINNNIFFSELLSTPAEWNQLIYNGGTIGTTQVTGVALKALDDSRRILPFEELTEEMDKALQGEAGQP